MVGDNDSGGRVPSGGQPVDPSAHRRPSDSSNRPRPRMSHHFTCTLRSTALSQCKCWAANVNTEEDVPYEFHIQNPTPQHQSSGAHPFGTPGQQPSYSMSRGQSQGGFNMSGMAGALPEYSHQSPSHMQPYDQQEFQGQLNSINYPVHPHQYPTPYQDPGSMGGYGSIQGSHRSHSGGPSPIHSAFPTSYFPHQHQQYMGYPPQYGQIGQMPYTGTYPPVAHHGYGRGDIAAIGSRQRGGYSAGTAVQYPYTQQGQFLRPGPAPGE